jgi:hypothetical protein
VVAKDGVYHCFQIHACERPAYRANQHDCAGVARIVESADHLPDDMAALKAVLIETRAKLESAQALIEHFVIAKMKREMFGPRSERSQRLIDQLELQLEELAAARTSAVSWTG